MKGTAKTVGATTLSGLTFLGLSKAAEMLEGSEEAVGFVTMAFGFVLVMLVFLAMVYAFFLRKNVKKSTRIQENLEMMIAQGPRRH